MMSESKAVLHFISGKLGSGKTTLAKKIANEDHVIFSFLNSSLDARVIDFVRRDSLHIGINEGSAVDLDLAAVPGSVLVWVLGKYPPVSGSSEATLGTGGVVFEVI